MAAQFHKKNAWHCSPIPVAIDCYQSRPHFHQAGLTLGLIDCSHCLVLCRVTRSLKMHVYNLRWLAKISFPPHTFDSRELRQALHLTRHVLFHKSTVNHDSEGLSHEIDQALVDLT